MTQLRRLAYPVNLQITPDTVLVSFPCIPEAWTEGHTEREALAERTALSQHLVGT